MDLEVEIDRLLMKVVAIGTLPDVERACCERPGGTSTRAWSPGPEHGSSDLETRVTPALTHAASASPCFEITSLTRLRNEESDIPSLCGSATSADSGTAFTIQRPNEWISRPGGTCPHLPPGVPRHPAS